MISNLKDYLNQLASSFFFWAMFTPRFFLKQQTRSRLLKHYMERAGNDYKSNLHHFIEEMLCIKKNEGKRIYVTKDELRNCFEQWAVKNGFFGDIPEKTKFLVYLPKNILSILVSDYRIQAEERRTMINKTRILTISGVTIRPENLEGTDLAPISLPKEHTFEFGEFNPFLDVSEIQGPDLLLEDFHGTQKRILEHRNQLFIQLYVYTYIFLNLIIIHVQLYESKNYKKSKEGVTPGIL